MIVVFKNNSLDGLFCQQISIDFELLFFRIESCCAMSVDPPKAPTPSPYYRKSTDSSYRNLLASVAAPDTDDASGQSSSQLLSSTMMLPPAPRRLATTTTESRETFV